MSRPTLTAYIVQKNTPNAPCNILQVSQCGMSAHHPTCELEDHPLSVAHDYVLNSFTAIRPLSMCHPMCHGIMIILILNTE